MPRRVLGYQRDNHNPEVEEGQTTQWPNEKDETDNQVTLSTLQNSNECTQ